MKNKPAIAVAIALVIAGFTLSACSTTEGVGRDLEDAGEEIQEEARDARR